MPVVSLAVAWVADLVPVASDHCSVAMVDLTEAFHTRQQLADRVDLADRVQAVDQSVPTRIRTTPHAVLVTS